ncbi:unnamed protein product [Phytomonas sp. EM1]|nr:unnamed protein product [Phytomonas sp. EM1]|eukprot:CCW62619.1 unnamed protein product [Phytomonas sp. isolate EM1]
MSTTRRSELVNRPCMITETGRVLPLPPNRAPSRSSKTMRLPTKRFVPLLSATEVVNPRVSCERSMHRQKDSPSRPLIKAKEKKKHKKQRKTVVSPRVCVIEDPKITIPEEIDADSKDKYLEKLSVTSFSKSDTYSESDSPRLDTIICDKIHEGTENRQYMTSSSTCSSFLEEEHKAYNTCPLLRRPESISLRIENENVAEIFENPYKYPESKRQHKKHDSPRARWLTHKPNQDSEDDPNSRLNNSKTVLVHNNWHLHIHSKTNKMQNNHVDTQVAYIEGPRGQSLARLTHLKGRNSWEQTDINQKVVEHSVHTLHLKLLGGVSPDTEIPGSSIEGSELAPAMPSLQGIRRTQQVRF